MLDMLCLTGEVGWARLSPTRRPRAVSRRDADRALPARARRRLAALRTRADPNRATIDAPTTRAHGARAAARARRVVLRRSARRRALDDDARAARSGSLVAAGLIASDGFAGLRALICVGARTRRRRAIAARTSPDAGPRLPGDARSRDAAVERRRGRCCAATASSSAACCARAERRAVARARARLSPPRSARRDPRRPLRLGHVAANSSRCRARSSGCASAPHAEEAAGAAGRSAPPIRSTSPASSPPASAIRAAARNANRLSRRRRGPLAVITVVTGCGAALSDEAKTMAASASSRTRFMRER
jgi:hypothetical protein